MGRGGSGGSPVFRGLRVTERAAVNLAEIQDTLADGGSRREVTKSQASGIRQHGASSSSTTMTPVPLGLKIAVRVIVGRVLARPGGRFADTGVVEAGKQTQSLDRGRAGAGVYKHLNGAAHVRVCGR